MTRVDYLLKAFSKEQIRSLYYLVEREYPRKNEELGYALELLEKAYNETGKHPEITPGCYVKLMTRNGIEGIVTEVRKETNTVFYRYEAIRNSDNKVIWPSNGDFIIYVEYLRPPDEKSREILKLRGPYGKGY